MVLFLHTPDSKGKKNHPNRQNSLLGFTSDQPRLRKFARRRFFVIRLARMRKIPSKATNARLPDFTPADFLSNIRPLGSRQEFNNQPVLPSDQTPSLSRLAHSRGSGMDQPSSVGADRRLDLHIQLPSLKAEERYFSSFHSFGESSLQLLLLWFGKTINRHKSVEPLLDVNRAKRSNGRTSDFRFYISVSKWPLCIQPNLVFYVVIIIIMFK